MYHQAFYEDLKRMFSESERYKGYIADDDPGYFIEWLVDMLYEMNRRQANREAACSVPLPSTGKSSS